MEAMAIKLKGVIFRIEKCNTL